MISMILLFSYPPKFQISEHLWDSEMEYIKHEFFEFVKEIYKSTL